MLCFNQKSNDKKDFVILVFSRLPIRKIRKFDKMTFIYIISVEFSVRYISHQSQSDNFSISNFVFKKKCIKQYTLLKSNYLNKPIFKVTTKESNFSQPFWLDIKNHLKPILFLNSLLIFYSLQFIRFPEIKYFLFRPVGTYMRV